MWRCSIQVLVILQPGPAPILNDCRGRKVDVDVDVLRRSSTDTQVPPYICNTDDRESD